MLTMCARCSRFSIGRKYFTPYTTPQKLIFISQRKSSSEISSNVPSNAAPALLMSSVTRPCLRPTFSANALTPASSATSKTVAVTSAAFLPSNCVVSASPASSISAIAIAEPAAASCCASARPIPEPAPVTTATPSLKNDIGELIARRHSSRRGRARPLASSFRTMYQQRTFRFERTQLLRIAKPPAGIYCWRWRWIHDSFVHHICESRVSKQLRPLVAGKQVRRHGEQLTPLVAVRIVAVIVDQNPSRPAVAQHAKNIFDSGGRIRPVVRRFHGNCV